jgi:hypothetical protein
VKLVFGRDRPHVLADGVTLAGKAVQASPKASASTGRVRRLTRKIEIRVLHFGGRKLRNLDFGIGNVRLSLQGPESSSTDGILVTKVNVVVRLRHRKIGYRDTHQFRRLAAGGNR